MVNVKARLKLYLLLVIVQQTIAVFRSFDKEKACTTASENKLYFDIFWLKSSTFNLYRVKLGLEFVDTLASISIKEPNFRNIWQRISVNFSPLSEVSSPLKAPQMRHSDWLRQGKLSLHGNSFYFSMSLAQ